VQPKPYDIRERSYLFAKEVVAFCRSMTSHDVIVRSLVTQLAAAAGSVGANLAEAVEAQTKPDFIHKNYFALKECQEVQYWLRLISDCHPELSPASAPLLAEARELACILRAIVIKAKRTRNRPRP
jgi:four helix bundle protein